MNIDFNQYKITDPEIQEKLIEAVREHHYHMMDQEFFQTDTGKTSLMEHAFGRYNRALSHHVPWIVNTVTLLKDKKIIEIGGGTGSSAAALSYFAKSVWSYEISQPSIDTAKEKNKILGIENVEFFNVTPESSLEKIRTNHPDQIDIILLFAVLEHMTIQERIEVLQDSWNLLDSGGLLIVTATPNRLTYYDGHTAWLPFFNMLPDDLALLYYKNSPRLGFVESIENYLKLGVEQAKLGLIRWGNGISFHEFEIAFQADLNSLVIADGDTPEMRKLNPVTEVEKLLFSYFEHAKLKQPRVFTHQVLHIIFRKP